MSGNVPQAPPSSDGPNRKQFWTPGKIVALVLVVLLAGGASGYAGVKLLSPAPASPCPLAPGFSSSPSSAEAKSAVTFTSSINCGGQVSLNWDFGDGTTAAGRSVSHTYASEGTYTVTLTATPATGSPATHSGSITVVPALTATIDSNSNPSEVGASTTFVATTRGGVSPVDCNWDFGDGAKASGCTTTHTYSSNGSFDVSATVADSLSVNVSQSFAETVNPSLALSSITASPLSGVVGVPVELTASTSNGLGAVSCSWTFGDSGSASGCTAYHTYSTAGTFYATVSATDSLGAVATGSLSLNVTVAHCPNGAVNPPGCNIYPTITTITCTPTTIESYNLTSTSCHIVVSSPAAPSEPTDYVSLNVTGVSDWYSNGKILSLCTLTASSTYAYCDLKDVTTSGPSGSMNIQANYTGDPSHARSGYSVTLKVVDPPSSVTVSGLVHTVGAFTHPYKIEFVDLSTKVGISVPVGPGSSNPGNYTITLTNMRTYSVTVYWQGGLGSSGTCTPSSSPLDLQSPNATWTAPEFSC